MNLRTLTAALLVLLAPTARAGFIDLFNGVSIGASLPVLDAAYIGEKPDTKNKLLLVDFWATWCVPCRASIPKLNELQSKFGERGLVVIGVTTEGKEVVQPFLAKLPVHYPVALDLNAKFTEALGIRALPYALIADSKGKIIWRGQPSEITETMLQALLPSARSENPVNLDR